MQPTAVVCHSCVDSPRNSGQTSLAHFILVNIHESFSAAARVLLKRVVPAPRHQPSFFFTLDQVNL